MPMRTLSAMRRLTVGALMLTAVSLVSFSEPPAALAYADAHFCGYVVQPGASCGGTMATANWRKVRTRYPGSSTITACVYMYNFTLGQYRGGIYCGPTSEANPYGKDFGPTSGLSYRSYNQLPGTVGPTP